MYDQSPLWQLYKEEEVERL